MIIKYNVSSHGRYISRVEVLRETETSVFTKYRRHAKTCDSEVFRDTPEECREWLRVHWSEKVKRAEQDLRYTQGKLAAVDNLPLYDTLPS